MKSLAYIQKISAFKQSLVRIELQPVRVVIVSLPKPILDKLGKLIPRLASDHPGEVVATVSAGRRRGNSRRSRRRPTTENTFLAHPLSDRSKWRSAIEQTKKSGFIAVVAPVTHIIEDSPEPKSEHQRPAQRQSSTHRIASFCARENCAMTLHAKTLPITAAHARPALADLAADINAAHQQAEQALRDGVLHAIRAGELLHEAKAQLPHGEWENWLKANVSFRPRTARAYMQIAELDPEKRQRVADLPMREALKAIAKRKYLTPQERKPVPASPRPATALQIAKADAQKARAEAVALMFPPETKRIPGELREALIAALGKLGSESAAERADAAIAVVRERARLSLPWGELIVPAAEDDELRQVA